MNIYFPLEVWTILSNKTKDEINTKLGQYKAISYYHPGLISSYSNYYSLVFIPDPICSTVVNSYQFQAHKIINEAKLEEELVKLRELKQSVEFLKGVLK